MNLSQHKNLFSREEQEILQEIMNIAFGTATAELTEVIDIYVQLNVPNVMIIGMCQLADYIDKKLKFSEKNSIVGQYFWGDFKGIGLMVLPSKSSQELMAILDHSDTDEWDLVPLASLEKEALIEVGNILIGACVGKVAELLNTYVSYSPPHVVHDDKMDHGLFTSTLDTGQYAIILETVFQFDEKNINGLLLITTSQDSIHWLKKALHDFMAPYQ